MAEREDLFDAVTVPIPMWDEVTLATLLPSGDDVRLGPPERGDAERGAPPVVAWTASLDDVAFADAVTAVTARLGAPHQILGDPTALRWWPGDTRQVILEADHRERPVLSIVPAHWRSERELADVDLGEPAPVPYRWAVDLSNGPDGVWVPGSRRPQDTTSLVREIEQVLDGFARASRLLPDELLHSGTVKAVSPERPLGENGIPYMPTVSLTVVGDPWRVELRRRGTVVDEASGDPTGDLPSFVEKLAAEIRSWAYEPSEIAIYVHAKALVPGKRAPKPVHRIARVTTLGGSNA